VAEDFGRFPSVHQLWHSLVIHGRCCFSGDHNHPLFVSSDGEKPRWLPVFGETGSLVDADKLELLDAI